MNKEITCTVIVVDCDRVDIESVCDIIGDVELTEAMSVPEMDRRDA